MSDVAARTIEAAIDSCFDDLTAKGIDRRSIAMEMCARGYVRPQMVHGPRYPRRGRFRSDGAALTRSASFHSFSYLARRLRVMSIGFGFGSFRAHSLDVDHV